MVSAEDMSLCDPYRELELYLEQANVSNTNTSNVQVILYLSFKPKIIEDVRVTLSASASAESVAKIHSFPRFSMNKPSIY